MEKIKQLQDIATQVRRDIIRMVSDAKSGHPGGSLGCADFMTALYFEVLEQTPETFDVEGKNQDMFFLSNGHISPVLYSVLARKGYFPVKELATFRKINSRLQGHPATHDGLPGIHIASGSLGQGLSAACGAAIAKKLNNDDKIIFTLHGDGELQEGQIWEAAMFAAAKKLDNIVATVDYNNKQIDGSVENVLDFGDIYDKWNTFGWQVLKADGNDMQNILNVLKNAKKQTGNGKPIVVIMKTEMGMGVDFMTGTHAWHGKAPNPEQTQNALKQLEETLGDY